MSKYIGPKLKLIRREGLDLYLKSGFRSIESKCKINQKPGQNFNKKNRLSDYGCQLREKQKLKRIYGVLEKQFINYYKKSIKMKGNTGEYLFQLLETRLDNIVYRMGFSSTRRESRQIINHKFIKVNNKIVNIPSYKVCPNDKISLCEKMHNNVKILFALELFNKKEIINWIKVDHKNFYGIFLKIPNRSDLLKDINENLIIELYSK